MRVYTHGVHLLFAFYHITNGQLIALFLLHHLDQVQLVDHKPFKALLAKSSWITIMCACVCLWEKENEEYK